MKKRSISIFLIFALVLTLLPMTVSAAAPRTPIYLGYDAVDYMAEEILKEIPTEGKSAAEQIRAVYDWVLGNFHYDQWNSSAPDALHFDEAEVEKASKGLYADAVKEGKIALRLELENKVLDAMALQDGLNYPWDTNEEIAAYAKDILLNRSGYVGSCASLMAVLLSHLGFDTRLVTDLTAVELATGIASTPNFWNYVLVDGHYYLLDAYAAQLPGANPDDYFMRPYNYYTDGAFYSAPLEEFAKSGLITEFYSESIALASDPWGRCSDWAYDYMQSAGEAGLIPDGMAGTRLDVPITREEFADVAVRLYEAFSGPSPDFYGENPFLDTINHIVLKAYGLGIVNGVGRGNFAPEATLTREQAVTMLGRAYELAETSAVSGGATLTAPASTFLDAKSIGDFAESYVNFFVDRGIVDGMSGNLFQPQGTMTREQAIKVAVLAAEILK